MKLNKYTYIFVLVLVFIYILVQCIEYYNMYKIRQSPKYDIKVWTNSSVGQNKPVVTIIGSVHGNEPAGYQALTDMLLNSEFDKYQNKYILNVFNDPNKYGRLNNQRKSLWGDINRLWPREYYTANSNNEIKHPIKAMMPYVQRSNLIIDIHEAVGYNRCEDSLGNTVYVSDKKYVPMLQNIIAKLNKQLNEKNICKQWDVTTWTPDKFSIFGLPLDKYIKLIPVKHRPVYILIEIPGQDDIQPLDKRVDIAKFLVNNILLGFESI